MPRFESHRRLGLLLHLGITTAGWHAQIILLIFLFLPSYFILLGLLYSCSNHSFNRRTRPGSAGGGSSSVLWPTYPDRLGHIIINLRDAILCPVGMPCLDIFLTENGEGVRNIVDCFVGRREIPNQRTGQRRPFLLFPRWRWKKAAPSLQGIRKHRSGF
jgi:hypothetical protein